MRTATKSFISKTKSCPTCSHINIQPNLWINHGGDEKLISTDIKIFKISVFPPRCRKKGGNLERHFPRSHLAAGQHLPAPASPRGNHSSSPCSAAAHLGTAGARHGHPAERQQASVENGMFCTEPAGEHVSKAHRVTGVPAMRDGRHGCCRGLFPDVCSPHAIPLAQTAVCP